jgi:hypothetical protein
MRFAHRGLSGIERPGPRPDRFRAAGSVNGLLWDGLIDYNGGLKINSSLLSIVLHD